MSAFGGMLAFQVRGTRHTALKLAACTRLFTRATSLGGVESLICSPVYTSHRYLTKEERLQIGIRDSLLRLSVGIENAGDLINDIEQAIALTLH